MSKLGSLSAEQIAVLEEEQSRIRQEKLQGPPRAPRAPLEGVTAGLMSGSILDKMSMEEAPSGPGAELADMLDSLNRRQEGLNRANAAGERARKESLAAARKESLAALDRIQNQKAEGDGLGDFSMPGESPPAPEGLVEVGRGFYAKPNGAEKRAGRAAGITKEDLEGAHNTSDLAYGGKRSPMSLLEKQRALQASQGVRDPSAPNRDAVGRQMKAAAQKKLDPAALNPDRAEKFMNALNDANSYDLDEDPIRDEKKARKKEFSEFVLARLGDKTAADWTNEELDKLQKTARDYIGGLPSKSQKKLAQARINTLVSKKEGKDQLKVMGVKRSEFKTAINNVVKAEGESKIGAVIGELGKNIDNPKWLRSNADKVYETLELYGKISSSGTQEARRASAVRIKEAAGIYASQYQFWTKERDKAEEDGKSTKLAERNMDRFSKGFNNAMKMLEASPKASLPKEPAAGKTRSLGATGKDKAPTIQRLKEHGLTAKDVSEARKSWNETGFVKGFGGEKKKALQIHLADEDYKKEKGPLLKKLAEAKRKGNSQKRILKDLQHLEETYKRKTRGLSSRKT